MTWLTWRQFRPQAVTALAALAEGFGPRVAALVAAVTNPEYAPGRDAETRIIGKSTLGTAETGRKI